MTNDLSFVRRALSAVSDPSARQVLLTLFLQEQTARVLRLATSQVSMQCPVSSLGLDSLMAVELQHQVEMDLGVVLPMASILQGASLSQLADEILAHLSEHPSSIQSPLIPNVPAEELVTNHTLSPGQRALWFLYQMAPESAAYNIFAAVRILSDVDIHALKRSFQTLLDRHASLRTTFATQQGGPVQQVNKQAELCFLVEDASGWNETLVHDRLVEEARRPFELEQGPVLRVTLLTRAAQEHILVLTIHHTVADLWSLTLLARELDILYPAEKAGVPVSLPSSNLQYTDYTHWCTQMLASPEGERLWSYWQQQLAGAPMVLDLPFDRPRPPVQTYCGASYGFTLNEKLTQQLKTFSQSRGVTLYMTLLTAFVTLLYRYTSQEDILVGSSSSGRNRATLANLVGYLVNPLVMRTKIATSLPFTMLLDQVRQTVLAAFEHQDYPFATLVGRLKPEREADRSPIFQVMFVFQKATLLDGTELTPFVIGQAGARIKIGGLVVESIALETGSAQFDLTLTIAQVGGELAASLQYNTDLFDASTMTQFADHFHTLLENLMTNPDQLVAHVPILTEAEKHQLLIEWNDTRQAYPYDRCVHQLFEEQVVRTPDATAAVFESEYLTYQALNQRANQLARYLQKLRVCPDMLVGICVKRSLNMIIGLLGILKAGGGYVPLDAGYPKERLAFMLEDTHAPVLLTQRYLLEGLPEYAGHIVCLDEILSDSVDECGPDLVGNTTPANLAYVIYTSGSTGRPKGVMISHQGLVNYLAWCVKAYAVVEGCGAPLHSALGFDLTITALFPPLMTGQRVVLTSEQEGCETLTPLLSRESDFSLVKITPAHLEMVSQQLPPSSAPGRTRRFVIGGEALRRDTLSFWQEHAPDTILINEYGPTETVVGCCIYQVPAGFSSSGAVPIGRPIANSSLYILDSHLQPVPVGVPGELYVGGPGLARGYLNCPDLTAEKFIPHPFSFEDGLRLYKTGDLARYLPDGNIEFLGRVDRQVKIRGFRVELEEIEFALKQHPAVCEAVVATREDTPGDRRLVAYVVQAPSSSASDEQQAEWSADQVSYWQMLYDELYNQAALNDPMFNIVGWDSSYTGQPIAAEEMQEWVDHSVNLILSLAPDRVLEIGCGTGLLLFRLAPYCSQYWGTDFSQSVVDYLHQQLSKRSLPQVKLFKRAANELPRDAVFDVVILNSVIQYFPSVDYLMQVLECAVNVVAPGGFIFLGDVRNFSLLEAFHTSVQLHQASPSLPIAHLRQRVYRQMTVEEELAIAPAFFTALKQRFPQIDYVQVQLRRGRYHNEMTKFRYNVVIHIGQEASSPVECQCLDWQKQALTLPGICQFLVDARPEIIGIRRVPNARLLADITALKLLTNQPSLGTVEDLHKAIEENMPDGGVDPEAMWAMADELSYSARITWSELANDCFDVVFRRCSSPMMAHAQAVLLETGDLSHLRPWHLYANNPLQARFMRKMGPGLRSHLKEKLPEYMLPSAFVFLDTLPLTPNGKVDHSALPSPDPVRPDLESAFVSPRTSVEDQLSEIWADVLGLERVGIHDNFFELGGDSILSIQIVARAHRAGIHFTPRQFFQYQTIAELATVVGFTSTVQAEQGLVIGSLPLTPIQHWFFNQDLPDPHYWNQALLLEIRSAMQPAVLEKAWEHVLIHHDALRLRFIRQTSGWQQFIATPDAVIPFTHLDLSVLPESEHRVVFEAAAAVCQASLNLVDGPLVRVLFFNRGAQQPSRLFVAIHHLAVDGVSWRILLEDLQTAYDQISRGMVVCLPPKTTSFKQWSQALVEYAQSLTLQQELDYWLTRLRVRALILPVDYSDGDNRVASQATVSVALSLAETQALLQDVPPAYHTQITDVLLTAMAHALTRWGGATTCLIDLEGHGREEIISNVDLSRTIGWFTTIFPVLLDLGKARTPADALKLVKEQLRAIPNRGIGYGLLRYLSSPEIIHQLHALPHAQVSFNYLGQLDQALPKSSPFYLSDELNTPSRSPRGRRSHLIDISVLVVGGQLRLDWIYSQTIHRQATIERLAEDSIGLLRLLIQGSLSPQADVYTPSDFPLAELDGHTLDKVAALLAHIDQGELIE